MAQGYRPGYSSTTLPPLQRNRGYPQATNGTTTRSYFDQPSQDTTPILPSQPIATESDRFGSVAGQPAFVQPGSANGTPR